MGCFQVDDYVVQNLNQGYRISWQTKNGMRVHMDLDLNQALKDMIMAHVNNIVRLIRLYNDPNAEAILDDNDGFQIVMHFMPPTDVVPGMHFRSEAEANEWKNRQFLLGCNRRFKTDFPYEYIREFL